MKKKCKFFANYHCSLDCPNLAIEALNNYWNGPAAEDMGIERMICKDCYLDSGECKDCFLEGTPDCPEHTKTERINNEHKGNF